MSIFQFKVKFDRKVYNSFDLNTAQRIVRNNNTKVKKLSALSNPSKLNCKSWSIPIRYCSAGHKLRSVKGSICEKCYAARGRYKTDESVAAMNERYEAWKNQPHWLEAMAFLINIESKTMFRWFDSGDVQGFRMLLQIMEIARHTSSTKHWLPTHEVETVANFVNAGYVIPRNMTIRLSSEMIDGEPLTELANELNTHENVKGYIGTSTVYTKNKWEKSNDSCPAPLQSNNCGKCTQCWKHTPNIGYKYH
jgi:hypothetical protein